MNTWSCKIGETTNKLRPGADEPMRKAVAEAYRSVTGEDPVFTFSGWGAELDEAERAVVEEREPDYFKTSALVERVNAIREYGRAEGELPEWNPEEWLMMLLVKLGQAAQTFGMLRVPIEQRPGSYADTPDGALHEQAMEVLLAAAAICMDAVESVDRQVWARQEAGEQ